MKKLAIIAALSLPLAACGSTAEQQQNLGELLVAGVVGAAIVCGAAALC